MIELLFSLPSLRHTDSEPKPLNNPWLFSTLFLVLLLIMLGLMLAL